MPMPIDPLVATAAESVTELPRATDPPPLSPVPAITDKAPEFVSCELEAVPPVSENCACAPAVI